MNRVGIYLCSCLLWLLLSFKAKAWISQRTIRISRSCRFSFNETSSEAPSDASGVESSIPRRPPIQRPIRRPVTVLAQDRREQQQRAVQRSRIANNDPFLLSDVRWKDLSMAPASLRAVTELEGWERLTQIQARSWPHVLNGTSLVAKARTGTGKTLAYLLPAIQRLLETDAKFFRPGRTIGLVVLAPTRELVIQIAQQASKLVTYHHAWTVQAFHGGGSIQKDRAVLYHRPLPTILVATPGRLYDLLREPCRVSGNRFFATVMGECRIVVLDEADQLLQGLSWEMNKLWSCIPRVEKRQTMLFSATISAKLEAILSSGNRTNILPLDFVTIDYEQKVDRSVEGPRVEEHCLQLRSMSQYVSGLFSLINHVMTNKLIHPKYKVLVFLPTAKLVNFFADLLAAASIPVLSIHSRMSQGSRQRASQSFHQSTARCVMLSSDISARGLDYPDVDLVVQYGAPFSNDLYLHRLGRTGRAGQMGCGLLVLLPFESSSRWKHIIDETDIFPYIHGPTVDVKSTVTALQNHVRGGHSTLLPSAEAAYLSFVAHYLEYGGDKFRETAVLEAAQELSASFGLVSIPSLPNDMQAKNTK